MTVYERVIGIPGIGPKSADLIRRAYPRRRDLRDAAFAGVIDVPGLTKPRAEAVIKSIVDEITNKQKKFPKFKRWELRSVNVSDLLSEAARRLYEKALQTDDPGLLTGLLNSLKREIDKGHLQTEKAKWFSQPQCLYSEMVGANEGRNENVVFVNFDVSAKKMKKHGASKAFLAVFSSYVDKLVEEGFTLSGTHFRYYASSPGQLKEGSACCLTDSELRKLSTPFSFDQRRMKNGTIFGETVLINKLLQWRMLYFTPCIASREIAQNPLRIKDVVIVPDFKKTMTATVRSITSDYKWSDGERDDLEELLADGSGLCDCSYYGVHELQVRFMAGKGVIVPCRLGDWLRKRKYSFSVTDVWNVPHKITEKTILVTESMAKNCKLYGSLAAWREAAIVCGGEELFVVSAGEDHVSSKALSRQMTQTLIGLLDQGIELITKRGIELVNRLCTVKGAYKKLSGYGKSWEEKTNLEKAITVYPQLMRTRCIIDYLKEIFVSLRDKLMSGKLPVKGGYHFAARDPYALLDVIVGGKDPQIEGLGILSAGEVYCRQRNTAQKVCVLRSPHAYMEWAVMKMNHSDEAKEWFVTNALYCSFYDLMDRILQCDYDGDHLLVIDDPVLVETAERTRQQYGIDTLFYDATGAKKCPLPNDPAALRKLIKEAIINAVKYNKVGVYSTYETYLWSLVSDTSNIHNILIVAALIAAAINHAVDACKTGLLNELPDWIVKKCFGTPYSDRYCKFVFGHPSADSEFWDAVTKPRKSGVIDRIGVYIESKLPEALPEMDFGHLPAFDYKELITLEIDGINVNRQVKKHRLNETLRAQLLQYGSFESVYSCEEKRLIENDEPIGYAQLFSLLSMQRAGFWKLNSSDDGTENANSREQLCVIARQIMTDYVESEDNLSEKQKAAIVANCLVKSQYVRGDDKPEAASRERRFVFEVFGDIYAEAVMTRYEMESPDIDIDACVLDELQPEADVDEREAGDFEAYDVFEDVEFVDDGSDGFTIS